MTDQPVSPPAVTPGGELLWMRLDAPIDTAADPSARALLLDSTLRSAADRWALPRESLQHRWAWSDLDDRWELFVPDSGRLPDWARALSLLVVAPR